MNTILESDLRNAVRGSRSVAGTIRLLGRASVGSNYRAVKREIARLKLDTSHWCGGSPTACPRIYTAEMALVQNGPLPRHRLRQVILRENILPYDCGICGMTPEWNGRPLVLRLDHKNGERNDDRRENLRFLCPNCDSQTPTFCGRNKKGAGTGLRSHVKRPCVTCNDKMTYARQCVSCAQRTRHLVEPQPTKITWPTDDEIRQRVAASSYLAVARELGVSDNAIRKRLRSRARVADGTGL